MSTTEVLLACGSCRPRDSQLRCRVQGREYAAFFDQEYGALCCTVPKDACEFGKAPKYDVISATGAIICTSKPSMKSEDEERVCDEACLLNTRTSGRRNGGRGAAEVVSSQRNVLRHLSWLDRLLPVWVLLAMVGGVLLGYFVEQAPSVLQRTKVAGVSLPIALGLWWMMFPVLTKVQYELLHHLVKSRGALLQFGLSLILNWVLGPALMTGLAWMCLPDLPEYRNGVIMVGLARCIAMVLIWNQLAGGHAELCAVLVAFNSTLQILLYAPLSLFYLKVVSGVDGAHVTLWEVTKGVLLFLGVPLVAGLLLRRVLLKTAGRRWFDEKFMPYLGPIALVGLLYTIVVMFAGQGDKIIKEVGHVARVALPMFLYFILMFVGSGAISWVVKMDYQSTVTQAFTAASNNFELAIAIAVATFGATSAEALAAVVGPLIEVPVLLGLVYVALWAGREFWPPQGPTILGSEQDSTEGASRRGCTGEGEAPN